MAGATRESDEEIEVLGWFKGGAEWAEGLADGWAEVARSTCWARGLIARLSSGASAVETGV